MIEIVVIFTVTIMLMASIDENHNIKEPEFDKETIEEIDKELEGK